MTEQLEREDSAVSEDTPAQLAVEYRSAGIEDVAFGKREITFIAVPYEQDAVVPYRGQMIRERFKPGAFDGIETRAKQITINRDHRMDRVVGIAKGFDTKSERGLITVAKLSDTPLGQESLQLAADGVLRASIAFSVRSQDMTYKDGQRTIYRSFVRHIALTPEPAYEDTPVLDVRTGQPIGDTPTPNLDIAAAILREIAAR